MKHNGPIETANLAGGENIAVLFGGWTGTAAAVKAWAEGLAYHARPPLASFAVGTLYSVPGPYDSGYGKREHALDALAASIAKTAADRGTNLIIVAAHSSGAFVADAALAALAKKNPDLLPKVVYFKLDGGWASDFKPAQVAKLGGMYCVAAKCGSVSSRNYGAMVQGCKAPSGGKAKVITVSAQQTGCKAPNCCHDALITTRPHDPNNFSVVKDYSDFAGERLPNGDWLKQAVDKLKTMSGH